MRYKYDSVTLITRVTVSYVHPLRQDPTRVRHQRMVFTNLGTNEKDAFFTLLDESVRLNIIRILHYS